MPTYAIYTRQSVAHDGDALSSSDAQFQICKALLQSRHATGWGWIGERFDDDGFSGSLAAYLMVHWHGLRWETIAHIPQNRKISKRTPDFLGYSSDPEPFLFEAKGTTQAQKVEKTVSDGRAFTPMNAGVPLGLESTVFAAILSLR